eukprot:GHVO01012892.1.p1 GENE.GHVO01012892.1~~GHVO01012892.1.p1  ORF type:complete len:130 (-),score=23.80 GHVO01012892.1:2-391(-)
MIRFLLFQNRQGRTRLSKWYVPYARSDKSHIESEIHRAVVGRERKWSNFVEFRSYKLIYRQYAGLFFTLCVDVNDNELAMYELMHLIVEVMDKFDAVYQILDEVILSGEIQETAHSQTITRLKQAEKLD